MERNDLLTVNVWLRSSLIISEAEIIRRRATPEIKHLGPTIEGGVFEEYFGARRAAPAVARNLSELRGRRFCSADSVEGNPCRRARRAVVWRRHKGHGRPVSIGHRAARRASSEVELVKRSRAARHRGVREVARGAARTYRGTHRRIRPHQAARARRGTSRRRIHARGAAVAGAPAPVPASLAVVAIGVEG